MSQCSTYLSQLRCCCSTSPSFKISLGSLGTFSMSAALVLQLKDILTVPGINWKYEMLYVPLLVPFVIASLLCIAINRKHMQGRWYGPLAVAWRKTMGEATPLNLLVGGA